MTHAFLPLSHSVMWTWDYRLHGSRSVSGFLDNRLSWNYQLSGDILGSPFVKSSSVSIRRCLPRPSRSPISVFISILGESNQSKEKCRQLFWLVLRSITDSDTQWLRAFWKEPPALTTVLCLTISALLPRSFPCPPVCINTRGCSL